MPAAGNMYVPSDGFTDWVSDGSAWRPKVLRCVLGTRPPAVASWSTFGSVALTTLSDVAGTVRLVSATNGTTQLNGIVRAKAGTETVTAFIALNFTLLTAGASEGGIIVRDNSTGKSTVFDIAWTNTTGMALECFRANGSPCVGTGVTNKVVNFGPLNSQGLFLRFVDDGTNHIYSYSNDGRDFTTFYSEVRSAWVPSGGDKVGVSLASSSTDICDMTLMSWNEV